MSIMGFTVRKDKLNQCLVSLNSFLRKNPDWFYTIYYDDSDVQSKVRKLFGNRDNFDFIKLDEACPVNALHHALKHSKSHDRLCMFSPNDICNRAIVGLDEADVDEYDLVIRPDRVFELTDLNEQYGNADPDFMERYERSRTYFTCGVVVYNLHRIREGFDVNALMEGWKDEENPDEGFYKHYLNRFFDGADKGTMTGN